jgi:signal transduction histidine kinase
MKTSSISRRLMSAFAAFTLGVSALFGLFAMAFVYTVEDRFFERILKQEAQQQRAHHARHGQWTAPAAPFITLHTSGATMPADLGTQWGLEPQRSEYQGKEGRHYHVVSLQGAGSYPLLVAEVSGQLIVRPIRQYLLNWLALWGAGAVVLSLALAWWLARRTSRPLENLAAQVMQANPAKLPEALVEQTRRDEIGTVARGLAALMARTRSLIEREQAFTRDASHELRTPLAVLRMSTERLREDTALPERLRAQANTMHAATLMMDQTVNTLLLLAREQGAAQNAATTVLPLVEKWALVHETLLDAQQATLDLQLAAQDTLALPQPVAQLLIANLLGNAVAHGTRGGTIRVEMSEHGQLLISNPSAASARSGGAPVQVAKNESSTGFGFGLAIVQRLLEPYCGKVTIRHSNGTTQVQVQAGTA